MTIANVIVSRDAQRVEIYSDTAVTSGSEGAMSAEISKALPIPHLQAVVTGRGHVVVIEAAWAAFARSGRDFDAAIAAFPDILTAAAAALRQSWPGIEYHNTLAVVGWSRGAGRYRLWLFTEQGPEGFTAEEVVGDLLMPWPADFGPAPRIRGIEGAIALAERQAAWIREQGDDYNAGGHLHRTTLEPGGRGVTIDAVHCFSTRTLNQLAAVGRTFTRTATK